MHLCADEPGIPNANLAETVASLETDMSAVLLRVDDAESGVDFLTNEWTFFDTRLTDLGYIAQPAEIHNITHNIQGVALVLAPDVKFLHCCSELFHFFPVLISMARNVSQTTHNTFSCCRTGAGRSGTG